MRSGSTRRLRPNIRQACSPQAAARFEAETEHVFELVRTNPGMFPNYDDEHRFAMFRRFPYSVVYQVQLVQVYVVAVAHLRRSAGQEASPAKVDDA